MKKLLNCLSRKTYGIIGAVALVLGFIAITPASLWTTHQPECPKELLK